MSSDQSQKLILREHFFEILENIIYTDDCLTGNKYILVKNYIIKVLEDGTNAIIISILDDCIDKIANMFSNLLGEVFDAVECGGSIYDYIRFDEPNIYLVCAILHYNSNRTNYIDFEYNPNNKIIAHLLNSTPDDDFISENIDEFHLIVKLYEKFIINACDNINYYILQNGKEIINIDKNIINIGEDLNGGDITDCIYLEAKKTIFDSFTVEDFDCNSK